MGSLDMSRWLAQHEHESFRHFLGPTGFKAEVCLSIHAAAVNGQLKSAKFLREQSAEEHQSQVIELADRRYGWMEREERNTILVRLAAIPYGWIHNFHAAHPMPKVVSAQTMTEAAMNGHLEVVKWLYDEYQGEIDLFHYCNGDTVAMDAAAKFGHLDVLQYLHESQLSIDSRSNTPLRNSKEPQQQSIPVYTSAAMNSAAANGHLEGVRWLHQNRNEGCTTLTMDAAATTGHLEVVQWLDEYRSEGCTVTAMDGASRNGHLERIKWLHSHRSEGCSANAMDGAAGNAHLEMFSG